jgi:hypothetical protein
MVFWWYGLMCNGDMVVWWHGLMVNGLMAICSMCNVVWRFPHVTTWSCDYLVFYSMVLWWTVLWWTVLWWYGLIMVWSYCGMVFILIYPNRKTFDSELIAWIHFWLIVNLGCIYIYIYIYICWPGYTICRLKAFLYQWTKYGWGTFIYTTWHIAGSAVNQYSPCVQYLMLLISRASVHIVLCADNNP